MRAAINAAATFTTEISPQFLWLSQAAGFSKGTFCK